MTDHTHSWQVFPDPNKMRYFLQCTDPKCNTLITINDLIANERQDAANEAKVKLLNEQLFKRELKKPAHDAAYAWVIAHSESQQEALL